MSLGEAQIKGKFITIKIPISVLSEEYVIPGELLDDDFKPKFKVSNLKEFARDFVAELNREAEDGSTPITDLLDNAYLCAVENGSLGIEDNTTN
jgi:hypothetical protein